MKILVGVLAVLIVAAAVIQAELAMKTYDEQGGITAIIQCGKETNYAFGEVTQSNGSFVYVNSLGQKTFAPAAICSVRSISL